MTTHQQQAEHHELFDCILHGGSQLTRTNNTTTVTKRDQNVTTGEVSCTERTESIVVTGEPYAFGKEDGYETGKAPQQANPIPLRSHDGSEVSADPLGNVVELDTNFAVLSGPPHPALVFEVDDERLAQLRVHLADDLVVTSCTTARMLATTDCPAPGQRLPLFAEPGHDIVCLVHQTRRQRSRQCGGESGVLEPMHLDT